MRSFQLLVTALVCCSAARLHHGLDRQDTRSSQSGPKLGCTPGEDIPGELPAVGEGKLPVLPDFFTAYIMWNMEYGERSSWSSQHKEDIPGNTGMSVEVRESFDKKNNRRALRLRRGMLSTTEEPITMEQTIVFNKGDNSITELLTADGNTVCNAEAISSDAILQFLLGYNASNPGHMPSIMEILHFGSQYGYKYMGLDASRNIPCRKWRACIPIPLLQANVEIFYWWSDPSLWTPAVGPGKSVPIRAQINGMGKIGDQVVIIHQSLDFQDFEDNEPPPVEHFQIPPDFYCKGRKSYTDLSELLKLTNYFSYKSELFAYFPLTASNGQHIGIINNQQVFFDYSWKVSRLDYKPADFASLVFGGTSQTGKITEIHEFSYGLTYQIDTVLGNCTVRNISKTDHDTDVVALVDGKVVMTNPMTYFDMDTKFYYNGMYEERGVKSLVYIAKRKHGVMEMAVVWYLSADGYLFEEDQLVQKKQPMKFITYPVDRYDDPLLRVEMNIYDFNQEEPNLQLYDISPCYDYNHRKNYIFSFPGSPDWEVNKHIAHLQYEVVAAITAHTLVSPLRINRVAIDNQGNEIYVLFTILDIPPVSGDYEFPTGILSLQEASRRLEEAVKNNKMVIRLPVGREAGTMVYQYAVVNADSLREIERYYYAYRLADHGYSGGDIAGLGIGMFIFGLLLAIGVAFILFRAKGNRSIINRSFENPFHSNSNVQVETRTTDMVA